MFPRESYGQVAAIADDERNHNLSVDFWPWGVIFGPATNIFWKPIMTNPTSQEARLGLGFRSIRRCFASSARRAFCGLGWCRG